MRYGRAERLIQLALEMQSTRGGLTLGEIEEKFDVSRRTAIRMRDAVLRAFPQAKEVPTGDRTKRWRLPSGTAQTFTDLTPEDLAVLETAVMALKQANLESHADNLRTLGAKVRNMLAADRLRHGLFEAVSAVYRLSMCLPTLPYEDFLNETAHLGDTEAEREQKVRIGQNRFRSALMDYWNATCPLTGVREPELLRASHIIPWAACSSDQERLNVHNGLLLSSGATVRFVEDAPDRAV